MRRTQQEIDTEIVDTAAGLFAVHGFERTSVQQVADAVGYSKTGLLHRFPSKHALLDAVEALIERAITGIQSFAADLEGDDDDDRQHRLLTMITETAMRYPGLVQYLLHSINSLQPGDTEPAMKASGDQIIGFIAGADAPVERQVRVILALELICSGVVLSRHPEHGSMGDAIGPLLVELAGGVIGGAAPGPQH